MRQPSHPPSVAVVATIVPPARPSADGLPLLWELVNDLQDGVMLSDENGTIVLATRRVAEMFGYPAAELAGRPVESLIPATRRTGPQRPAEPSRQRA